MEPNYAGQEHEFPNRQTTGTDAGAGERSRMRQTMDSAKETAKQTLDSAKQRLSGAASYTQEKAAGAMRSTQDMVQRAPMSSVMVALGVGIAIGWLLADRWESESRRTRWFY